LYENWLRYWILIGQFIVSSRRRRKRRMGLVLAVIDTASTSLKAGDRAAV
jgi:hypothetical protein